MIESMIVEGTAKMTHNWGWFVVFGVALLLLGISPIVRSVTTAVVSMVCLGWMLMLASAIEFVSALLIAGWTGFLLHLSMAIILAISGVLVGHSAQ
jgi:uncharacterized membrane protein HdeD (DUF308 family)